MTVGRVECDNVWRSMEELLASVGGDCLDTKSGAAPQNKSP